MAHILDDRFSPDELRESGTTTPEEIDDIATELTQYRKEIGPLARQLLLMEPGDEGMESLAIYYLRLREDMADVEARLAMALARERSTGYDYAIDAAQAMIEVDGGEW